MVKTMSKRSRLLPLWISTPLVGVGGLLAILYPFGHHWVLYALALAAALGDALYVRATTRVTLLSRVNGTDVIRIERSSLFDKYPTHPADEWIGDSEDVNDKE
jgi:hypothetical protein